MRLASEMLFTGARASDTLSLPRAAGSMEEPGAARGDSEDGGDDERCARVRA